MNNRHTITANCSRRRLLQMAGTFVAAQPLHALAESLALERRIALSPGTRLYATLHAPAAEDTGVASFIWKHGIWSREQFIPAPQAMQIVADVEGDRLFVTHRAGISGSPAASVELLHLDARTGLISRGTRHALALASRTPLALALSPDRHLLVVVAAGGVFSLLPVVADRLEEVSAAHKQLAVPLSRESAVLLAFHAPPRHDAQFGAQANLPHRLMLQTDLHGIEYECRADGLRCTAATNGYRDLQAENVSTLPIGVRSYALLPPL